MSTFPGRVFIWGLALALLISVAAPWGASSAAHQPLQGDGGVEAALQAGLQEAVLQRQKDVLAFVLYRVVIDRMQISADGRQAILWLALAERDSERILATEPGLAVAFLQGDDSALAQSWRFGLQVDEDWQKQLAQLQPELISDDQRASFLSAPDDQQPNQQIEAIGGYHLPWANGRYKYLEGSIAHYLIYKSCANLWHCYYAYDFADGTMFPLVAARGGTVYTYYDGCANGDHSCSNYIVLKDTSTNPTTYQLYLHIANHSVPSRLRTVGAAVLQGEYIANVDDTGYSTGHHLHFHVFTYFTSSYWGPSVDITFDEVAVNGGRPRTCNEAENWPGEGDECISGDWYVSGNNTPYPPSGGLTVPAAFQTLTDPNLTVSGWASDREGINMVWVSGQWGGTWYTLTTLHQTSFSTPLNLCSLGVPNGPMELSMTVEDQEGNRRTFGQRTLLVNITCPSGQPPQPACQPDSDEVALYSDANYQGSCVILPMRETHYNSPGEFSPVGNNDVESILLGSDVRAQVYHNGYFGGREESLEVSDPNLADNLMGSNTISSLKLLDRSELPAQPVLSPLTAPATSSLLLTWDGAGATQYKVELFGPNNSALLAASRDYAAAKSWAVGTLTPGTYTLKVTARNSAGTAAAQTSITITTASLGAAAAISLPYSANFDDDNGGWLADGWQWVSTSGGAAWTFPLNTSVGVPPAGSLTSPPILLPASPASELRFNFLTDIEGAQPFWDQMYVQVAPEGGKFLNLYQISGQVLQNWLASPALDLSAYAGQTVRIRFYFNAADTYFNDGAGWVVDDVLLQATPPPATCAESTRNDSWQTASPMGTSASGVICPNGDVDFYAFSGTAGQHLMLSVSTAAFTPQLGLLDANGGLLLQRGSPQNLILPYSGTYYARVASAAHPGQGGSGLTYSLNALADNQPPQVSIINPPNYYIPPQPFALTAHAEDAGGVVSVTFYWHSGTWPSNWNLLGADTNGGDGWSVNVNPSALAGLAGGALYARAVDTSGNIGAAWRVGMVLDTSAPVVALQPLASPYPATVIRLDWTGSDVGAGIERYELQARVGTGEWTVVSASLPAGVNRTWYTGQFGQIYGFRLRAVDFAGNVSAYQTVSTTVESTCTPDGREDGDDLETGAALLSADDMQANLCGLGDADYYRVAGEPGQTLFAVSSSPYGAAVRLELIQGGTVLAEYTAPGPGSPSTLRWQVQNGNDYYLRVSGLDGVAGSNAIYTIRAFEPIDIYFPLISR